MRHLSTGHLPDGPWDQAFWFELPGPPRSKSNARRYSGRGSAADRAYKANAAFVEQVATVADVAVPKGWELGPRSGRGSLARRPQVVTVALARTTLDTTNLPKSLNDAVEGKVFHNDASVRAALQQTLRGRSSAGGVVGFARLPAEASPQQVAAAVAALHQQVLEAAAELIDGFDQDAGEDDRENDAA